MRQQRCAGGEPIPSLREDLSAYKGAQELAASNFEEGVTKRSILDSLKELLDTAEVLTEQRIREFPPVSSIDCRAGCSHCCHIRVLVTVVEAILLGDYIRATFSALVKEDVTSRVCDAEAVTRALTDEEHGHAGIRCPLLKDDCCSVYEARPMECRGYVSMDVKSCRRGAKDFAAWDVPVYSPRYSIFKNLQAGLLSAMFNAGFDHELLSLNSALRIALEHPDAAEQWLAGKDVFAPARVRAPDPELDALRPWSPTF